MFVEMQTYHNYCSNKIKPIKFIRSASHKLDALNWIIVALLAPIPM